MSPAGRESLTICVDVGSTFTKALLVDRTDGRVRGAAEHATTIGTDVLDGVGACLARLVELEPQAEDAELLVCSSAGGGLRIAAVGNEELVTAEAARRVALSSGGTVVTVVAAAAGPQAFAGLTDAAADVVLLTGGTDGGNAEMLISAARELVAIDWRGPVVVAGNLEAQPTVVEFLGSAGVSCVPTDNVVPRIGVLAPEGARAALREVFVSHVIGGKQLSHGRLRGRTFAELVRGATPDVVLLGVEQVAAELGNVVVVDIGGATTDVHSVVDLDPEDAELARDVVAPTRVARTVEGDLGMRWSALTTLRAAGLPETGEYADHARACAADPGRLPTSPEEHDADEALARTASGLALRRHAGRARVVLGQDGRVVERDGTDLREVAWVIGSGGVLRHGRDGVAERVFAGSVATDGRAAEGGWQLPERAGVRVDRDYVLAATGLIALADPSAARLLARRAFGEGGPGIA